MFGHKIERRQTRVATIVVALALLFIGCFSSVGVAKAATMEELQAMIATLMAQIAAMQATSGGAVGATTGTSTAVVQVGTPVVVTAPLRVRVAPGVNSLFIATQPVGATGVVIEGPVVKDGYNWFKVDYATGTDGWNVGGWLRARTDLPDILGKYVGYMDGKQFIATENISRAEALANCKLNATNNPTAVVRCTWRGEEIYVSTSVKSTPRIIEAMGPADASFINATIVFGMPLTGIPAVTGPANIGSINWGDGTAVETVFELISGREKTVRRKHVYASNGSYTITVTGLDGKTDTKTVSISMLPQPKPVTTGLYRGYKSGRLSIETPNLSKATAQTNCQTLVAANPTVTVRCEWNSKVIFATGVIYENPDIPVRVLSVTNSKNPTISGTASGTAVVRLSIDKVSDNDTVYGSGDIAVTNGSWSHMDPNDLPSGKYRVEVYVNDIEVARRDFTIELSTATNATNTPNKNAFGCGRTLSGGTFANGVVGCYGMWDYGETFGGDHRMCGSYGEGKIGCQIKTAVCTSGNAKATAYYAGSDLTATKLNTISARLNTTPEIAKNGIAGLWEYSCTPAPTTVGAITTFTASPALVPSNKNGTQVVALSWSSSGTGICSVYEDTKGGDSIKLVSDQPAVGTFSVTPTWAASGLTTAKQYRAHCSDAVTDTFIDKTILVKLQATTTGAVLGASTDIYAEIARTLAGIQAALNALK